MTITLLFTAVIISDILLWMRSLGYWAKAKDYVTAWINERDDLAIAVSDVLETPYNPVPYMTDDKQPDDARFSSPAYDYSKPKAMTAKPDKKNQRKTAAMKRKERDTW